MSDNDLPESLSVPTNAAAFRNGVRREGQAWEHFSDTELVGIVASQGADRTRDAAAVEMQRRLMATFQTSSDSASRQTEHVIALTEQLRRLTIVITWLTVFAVIFGAIQASAVVVHFYRWLRGWG
jgi:hypothetical protein